MERPNFDFNICTMFSTDIFDFITAGFFFYNEKWGYGLLIIFKVILSWIFIKHKYYDSIYRKHLLIVTKYSLYMLYLYINFSKAYFSIVCTS